MLSLQVSLRGSTEYLPRHCMRSKGLLLNEQGTDPAVLHPDTGRVETDC